MVSDTGGLRALSSAGIRGESVSEQRGKERQWIGVADRWSTEE